MKYTLGLRPVGQARDIKNIQDFHYTSDEQTMKVTREHLGWDLFDFDIPTGMWIEVVDGDYGDIYVTFSSRPFSIYVDVLKVVQKWEEDKTSHRGIPQDFGAGWLVHILKDDDDHLNLYIENKYSEEIIIVDTGQGDGKDEQLALRFTTAKIEREAR
ncbi:MAG: hypothetical protein ACXABY_02530 [Candidatus Thorarchaeota archaeon]|jgi:hypothetical protein